MPRELSLGHSQLRVLHTFAKARESVSHCALVVSFLMFSVQTIFSG